MRAAISSSTASAMSAVPCFVQCYSPSAAPCGPSHTVCTAPLGCTRRPWVDQTHHQAEQHAQWHTWHHSPVAGAHTWERKSIIYRLHAQQGHDMLCDSISCCMAVGSGALAFDGDVASNKCCDRVHHPFRLHGSTTTLNSCHTSAASVQQDMIQVAHFQVAVMLVAIMRSRVSCSRVYSSLT